MPLAAAAVTTRSQAASKIRLGPKACQKAISNSRPGARPRTNRVMITRSGTTLIIPWLHDLEDASVWCSLMSGPPTELSMATKCVAGIDYSECQPTVASRYHTLARNAAPRDGDMSPHSPGGELHKGVWPRNPMFSVTSLCVPVRWCGRPRSRPTHWTHEHKPRRPACVSKPGKLGGQRGGPRRGLARLFRTDTLRAGGSPRFNGVIRLGGALRRRGTSRVIIVTSRLHVGAEPKPGPDCCIQQSAPGVVVFTGLCGGGGDQDGRTVPPNSSWQCRQKVQYFWLQSSDWRFGQYIPEPIACRTIGNRTWVARKSDSPMV